MHGNKPIFSDASIEFLPKNREESILVTSFDKDCVDPHWHFHPEVELILIEKGQGLRYVGHSVESFGSGDYCLLGSNLPHAHGSHPIERTGARWSVLHFLPENFGSTFWKLPENRRIWNLIIQSQRGIAFKKETAGLVKTLLQKMIKKNRSARMSIWLELLDYLSRLRKRRFLNPPSYALVKPQAIDTRLQKIMSWIDESFAFTNITQAYAARTLGMSPQAFSRFFHKGTGRTFQYYVNEVRIARVCSELLNSEKTISEIAFNCGFNNLANFNCRFRKITGQTPVRYRTMEGGVSGKPSK